MRAASFSKSSTGVMPSSGLPHTSLRRHEWVPTCHGHPWPWCSKQRLHFQFWQPAIGHEVDLFETIEMVGGILFNQISSKEPPETFVGIIFGRFLILICFKHLYAIRIAMNCWHPPLSLVPGPHIVSFPSLQLPHNPFLGRRREIGGKPFSEHRFLSGKISPTKVTQVQHSSTYHFHHPNLYFHFSDLVLRHGFPNQKGGRTTRPGETSIFHFRF